MNGIDELEQEIAELEREIAEPERGIEDEDAPFKEDIKGTKTWEEFENVSYVDAATIATLFEEELETIDIDHPRSEIIAGTNYDIAKRIVAYGERPGDPDNIAKWQKVLDNNPHLGTLVREWAAEID